MKTAAGSGHKRGDLPPPGPVLHKLGPDFQLLAVEDHVGLITQGKPEVGVIKEVHFLVQVFAPLPDHGPDGQDGYGSGRMTACDAAGC
jgi:hypothetical protein